MKFTFNDRPYPGNQPRPAPEVLIDEALGTLIVATPWGSRAAARKVIDRMVEYITFAAQDREATSPLQRLTCLSNAANNLRTATLLANDMLYREDNRDEYRAGVELFAATLIQNELSWIQVGAPHILLARGRDPLMPIGSQMDLSLDLSVEKTLPALPAQLLGLDTTVNPTINSFRARPGDQIVLLSHSRVPTEIFSMTNKDLNLDEVVRRISKTRSGTAFWLGLLSVVGEATQLAVPNGDVA